MTNVIAMPSVSLSGVVGKKKVLAPDYSVSFSTFITTLLLMEFKIVMMVVHGGRRAQFAACRSAEAHNFHFVALSSFHRLITISFDIMQLQNYTHSSRQRIDVRH